MAPSTSSLPKTKISFTFPTFLAASWACNNKNKKVRKEKEKGRKKNWQGGGTLAKNSGAVKIYSAWQS